jgi:hypothetical protein
MERQWQKDRSAKQANEPVQKRHIGQAKNRKRQPNETQDICGTGCGCVAIFHVWQC